MDTDYQPLYERPDDPYIDVPQSEVEDLKKKRLADNIIIDQSNFSEHFFDVRWSHPKDGQVLARFRGRAEFIDGQLKRDVINLLLKNERGGDAANKVIRKLACASERDAIRLPMVMATDLASGMNVEEVCAKIYEYDLEAFYYTQPENVPQDSHWQVIRLAGKQKSDGEWEITSNIVEQLAEYGLDFDDEEEEQNKRKYELPTNTNKNEVDDSTYEYGRQIRNRDVGTEMGCRSGQVECRGPTDHPTTSEE